MFIPRLEITPPLLASLTRVERLYGQIEALRLPRELQLNLERDNLVRSSFASNSIEGNPLSLPEVTNLLLGDRLPVNRDEKEVRNYFNLLKTLPTIKDFTMRTVLDIHRSLMTGVNDGIAGRIRDTEVFVGSYVEADGQTEILVKHNPPYHRAPEIEYALIELLDWLDEDDEVLPIVKAGVFHHRFVYLHPFVDGNGRACRLLTALLLLQSGYQINRYFVLDDFYDVDRERYSDSLHEADQGHVGVWLEYFTEGVEYSLQSALAKATRSLSTLDVPDRPSPREREVLMMFDENKQITTSEVAARLNVSRQQAHKLLAGLIDKGLVIKQGSTKASYYELR
jgi:Fic family protein